MHKVGQGTKLPPTYKPLCATIERPLSAVGRLVPRMFGISHFLHFYAFRIRKW